MKKIIFTALIGIFVLTSAKSTEDYTQKAILENNIDSVSYALGILNGTAVTAQLSQSLPFNITDSTALPKLFINYELSDVFVKHFSNMFEGLNNEAFKYGFYHQSVTGKAQMTPVEANRVCDDRFSAIRAKKALAEQAAKQKNMEEGKSFLAENATKPGVVTLESGLQYKIEKAGSGEKPVATDRVKVHYTGKLLDGTVFDSSVERGEPIVLPLNNVIKGWVEVLQLMPTGSKWTVYIPSNLAYGEHGSNDIPGNATLIFEIELLEIIK